MINQDVDARVAAYKGNPEALQQKYSVSNDLLDLLALQQIKSSLDAAKRQMQLQMAQKQAASGQAPTTIADQRQKEVSDLTKEQLVDQQGALMRHQQDEQQANMSKLLSGIAQQPGAQTMAEPQAMAAGGIVAFAGPEGSQVKSNIPYEKVDRGPEQELSDEAKEARKRAQERLERLRRAAAAKNVAPAEAAEAEGLLYRMGQGLGKAVGGVGRNVGTLISEGLISPAGRLAAGRLAGPAGAAATGYQIGRGIDEATGVGKAGVEASGLGSLIDKIYGQGGVQLTPEAQGRLANMPNGVPAPPAPVGTDRPTQMTTATDPRVQAAAPEAPAAPAAPAAGGAPMGGPAAAPAANPLGDALRQQAIRDMAINPQARQLEEEKRVEGRLALTPQQRAVYDEGIAGLQGMYKTDFDPERQRQEGLKRYLLGMGSRTAGQEFGGGAATAMDYDAAQRAQQLNRFKDIQRSREGVVGLEREATRGGIEGGYNALKAGSEEKRQGIAAAEGAYRTDKTFEQAGLDRASRERIAQMEVGARTADRALQREQNATTNADRQHQILTQRYSLIQGKIQDAVKEIDKNFTNDLGMLQFKLSTGAQLTPAEDNAYKIATTKRDAAVNAVKSGGLGVIAKQLETEIMSSGSGTAGWGNLQVTPGKK